MKNRYDYVFWSKNEILFGSSEVFCRGKASDYVLRVGRDGAECSCPMYQEAKNCKHVRYLLGILTRRDREAFKDLEQELDGKVLALEKGDKYTAEALGVYKDDNGMLVREWLKNCPLKPSD